MSALPRPQRGVAVVMAILMMALAASIAVYIAWQQQLWIRQAENLADQAQGRVIAQAGADYGRWVLREDLRRDERNSSHMDALTEEWARALPLLPVENGTVTGQVTDAQGLVNLNNLAAASTTQLAILQRLLQSLQLDPELAAAIRDWTTANAQASSAADLYYLGLPDPYRAAHQNIVDTDELIRIKGFNAQSVAALKPYVSALPGVTAINVNTAPGPVIAALFDVSLDDAKALLRVRDGDGGGPFKNMQDFRTRAPHSIAEHLTGTATGSAGTSTATPAPTATASAAQTAAGTGSTSQTVAPAFGTDWDVQSKYFLIRSRSEFGRVRFGLSTLVRRDTASNLPAILWQHQLAQ